MVVCCRCLLVLALLATIASTLRVYPHQLAYFNETAGGPRNGFHHLLHSSVDSGQDLLLVKDWLRSQSIPPHEYRIVSYLPYCAQRVVSGSCAPNYEAHWEIVSANRMFQPESQWRIYLSSKSTQRIGYSMWAVQIK